MIQKIKDWWYDWEYVIEGYPISTLNGIRCNVRYVYGYMGETTCHIKLEKKIPRMAGGMDDLIWIDEKYIQEAQ